MNGLESTIDIRPQGSKCLKEAITGQIVLLQVGC